MSIDATKGKIARLENEIEKQRIILKEKGSKLIEESGLLDLNISEKELKKGHCYVNIDNQSNYE